MLAVRRTIFASLALIFVLLIWSLNWLLIKQVADDIDALTFTAWRLLGAAILIALARRLLGQSVAVEPGDRVPLAVVGLLQMAGALGLCFVALRSLPVGHAAFLFFTMPLWLFLLEFAGGRAPFTWLGAAAVGSGTLGLFLLQHDYAGLSREADLRGWSIMLVAALCWAGGVRLYRARIFRTDLWSQTVWQLLTSGACLMVLSLFIAGRGPTSISPALVAVMLFNWVFATGLGYVAWHYVLRHLSSALASQALMLIPIEAAALGAAFRDDPITPSAMIAAVLIICGVSLTLWRDVLRPGAGRSARAAAAAPLGDRCAAESLRRRNISTHPPARRVRATAANGLATTQGERNDSIQHCNRPPSLAGDLVRPGKA
jgi:drug/metabolite transporter (DMT)-like permease